MTKKLETGIIFLSSPECNFINNGFNSLVQYYESLKRYKVYHWSIERKINPDEWSDRLRQDGISTLVLAGANPGLLKPPFTTSMQLAGSDPGLVRLAFLKLNSMDKTSGMVFNKSVILSAITGVPVSEIIVEPTGNVNDATLVIGGGIAGIQASLEIASGNKKVYLLEKSPTIGGHMAMFDKTFPTLDCAACILTPKMVEVGQNPNIELLTYSELVKVEGGAGNFSVKIRKKSRRVNLSLCIGCGTCAEKCPSKAPSEFDENTTLRKAIYIPFPQAVPNKYVIDAKNCTYVKNGKCGVCVKVCPVEGCIDLDQEDKTIEVKVGNIIVATGFRTFDPTVMDQFGYGKYQNVITSLELERLVNASGPTGGNITYRTQDKKGNWIFEPAEGNDVPHSFAIIHCVGSRDRNHNKYCSRVCCMYSLKLAHLIREKDPESTVYEFYIDMRAFGKGYEEFYERIKSEGVHIIRGKTAKVSENNGKLKLRSEDILNDRMIEKDFDMVVLSVGLEPGDDAGKISRMLGIEQDENGWFTETDYYLNNNEVSKGGIKLAGVCQGPRDIPDTVAHASSAASEVLSTILTGKISAGKSNIDTDETDQRIDNLIMKED